MCERDAMRTDTYNKVYFIVSHNPMLPNQGRGTSAKAHLVSIAPLIVLGANVLVWVLGALLQRRHVVPVLPVSLPKVPGVGTRESQGGDDGAS